MDNELEDDIHGNPDFSKFPEKITLYFKNKAHKEHFLGQLSDGWGENYVSLDWAYNNADIDDPNDDSGDLCKANEAVVTCIDEYFDEEEE